MFLQLLYPKTAQHFLLSNLKLRKCECFVARFFVHAWPQYAQDVKKSWIKKYTVQPCRHSGRLLIVWIKLFVPMRTCHPNNMSDCLNGSLKWKQMPMINSAIHFQSQSRLPKSNSILNDWLHHRMIVSASAASEWALVWDFPAGWLLMSFLLYSIRICCVIMIMMMMIMMIVIVKLFTPNLREVSCF